MKSNSLESKNIKKYDLIVIGSGAGLEVANAAAQSGLKVAIVEKSRMGGTCLNRGCIPSKLLIHSADVAEIIKMGDLFGIRVEKFSIDFQKIVDRVNGIIDSDSNDISNAFKNNYVISDEALHIYRQPGVLTIIGGGYIAAELSHFFGSLGTKVNIIHHRETLIPDEDEEISKKFTEIYSKKYNVYLECVSALVTKKNGKFEISAKTRNSGRYLEIESDQLLVATGRVPNSDNIDLSKTGVDVDGDGFIKVNKTLETNVEGIFALGDIIGRYQFRHSANLEAQYAYYNILNYKKKIPVDYSAMPHAIFSSPQVAGVGYTEQELKQKSNKDYVKSIYRYIDTAMGRALEDKEGFVKFLVSKETRKILGCHIIGTHASVLIHEVLVAMKSGDGTIDNISKTVHVHPALSEVVARAAVTM